MSLVDSLVQKIERARDVRIDKVLPAVSDNVRFVLCRRMEDGTNTFQATADTVPVRDRSWFVGELGCNNIDPVTVWSASFKTRISCLA